MTSETAPDVTSDQLLLATPLPLFVKQTWQKVLYWGLLYFLFVFTIQAVNDQSLVGIAACRRSKLVERIKLGVNCRRLLGCSLTTRHGLVATGTAPGLRCPPERSEQTSNEGNAP